MAYRHVVLFRFHDHVPEAAVDHAVTLLRGLADAPGVRAFDVRRSDDERKGRVVLELAEFDDRAAFEAWRDGDAHRDAGTVLRDLADWLVADHPLDDA